MQWSELKRRAPLSQDVAATYGEEGLVVDARSAVNPAEQVNRRLSSLLALPQRPAPKRLRAR
jgi:hypothetical protein